jgi:hypothetical protein
MCKVILVHLCRFKHFSVGRKIKQIDLSKTFKLNKRKKKKSQQTDIKAGQFLTVNPKKGRCSVLYIFRVQSHFEG